jgi:hypothetical protein
MYFEVIGEIENIEEIAVGGRIRDIMRIQNQYGPGRWPKLKGVATARRQARPAELSCTGMKRTASARRRWKSRVFWIKTMAKENYRFAVCVENKDCEDLEKRKIYQVIPDKDASRDGYLRVIDESGEDYLYPQSYFILVQLPREAQEALQLAK